MAQIKKLQNGSKLTKEQRAEKKLENFNLSKEGKDLVIASLNEFMKLTPEQFKQTELVGPDSYEVTAGGDYDFSGSSDPVKNNWLTGRSKVKDPNDANNIAATIYSQVLKELDLETQAEAELAKKNRNSYGISKYDYNLEDVFEDQGVDEWLSQYTTNEARQSALLPKINAHLDNYITRAESDPNNTYTDVDKVKTMRDAITASGWKGFTDNATTLGWNDSKYLLSASQLQTIADNKTAKDAEAKKKSDEEAFNARVTQLSQTLGFPEEVAADLVKRNLHIFTPSSGNYLEEDLQKYLNDKQWYGFRGNEGELVFYDRNFDPQQILGSDIEEGSALSGHQWTYDQLRGRAVHSDYTYPIDDYQSIFNMIPVGPSISASAPSVPWKGSNTYFPGKMNSSSDLQKELEKYEKEVENLMNKDINGNYIGLREGGNKNAANDSPAAILKKALIDHHYDIPLAQRKRIVDLLSLYNEGLRALNIQPEAAIDYSDHSDANEFRIIGNQITNGLKGFWGSENPKYKKGGILKFQDGSIFKEYKKRIEAEKAAAPPKERQFTTPKDIRGTWKDMGADEKAWRATSIAGAVGSLAPGVGAIGAGTSLVADIMADVVKDGFQASDVFNWNTAFNAGFVGLSLLGLGALKPIMQAGKLGKAASTAKKGTDLAEVLLKSNKFKSSEKITKALGLTDEGFEGIKALQNFAKKKGIKTTEELVERVGNILKKGADTGKDAKSLITKETATKLEQGVKALNKIVETANPVMGNLKLGKVAGTLTSAGKTGAVASGNGAVTLGKWAAKAAMVSPLVTDLPKTLYTGVTDGWEYTKPQDIKNIAIGAASTSKLFSRYMNARSIKGKEKHLVEQANKAKEIAKKPIIKEPIKNRTSLENTIGPKTKQSKADEIKYSKEVLIEENRKARVNNMINNVDDMKGSLARKRRQSSAISTTPKTEGKQLTLFENTPIPKVSKVGTNESNLAKIKEAMREKLKNSNRTSNSQNNTKRFIKDPEGNWRQDSDNTFTWFAKADTKKLGWQQAINEMKLKRSSGKPINKIAKGGLIPKFQNPTSLGIAAAYMTKNYLQGLNNTREDWSWMYNKPYDKSFSKMGAYLENNTAKMEKEKYQLNSSFAKSLRPDYIDQSKKFSDMKPFDVKTAKQTEADTGRRGLLPNLQQLGKSALGNLDNLSISNAAMFASTLNANRQLEKNRRRSVIAEGSFRESYMPQAPFISPLNSDTMLAQRSANELRSRINRGTKSININDGIAAQLDVENQIADRMYAIQSGEKQRRDGINIQNANSTYQTNLHNLGVSNRNRSIAAKTEAELAKDPTDLLNHTAFTNFITSANQNFKVRSHGKAVDDYYKTINNKDVMSKVEVAQKAYKDHIATYDATKTAFETANKAVVGVDGKPVVFEEHSAENAWKAKKEELYNAVKTAMEPISVAKMRVEQFSMNPSYFSNLSTFNKKGGTLEREKLEAQKTKDSSSNNTKEKELLYKAIFHNNEILLKTLSILFK